MDDISMIANPDVWPLWPLLPMKRRDERKGLVSGFLLSSDVCRLYHGDFYDVIEGRKQLKDLQTTQYQSPQAMVNEGWKID